MVRSLAQVDFVKFDNESICRIDPFFFPNTGASSLIQKVMKLFGGKLKMSIRYAIPGKVHIYTLVLLYFCRPANLQIVFPSLAGLSRHTVT